MVKDKAGIAKPKSGCRTKGKEKVENQKKKQARQEPLHKTRTEFGKDSKQH